MVYSVIRRHWFLISIAVSIILAYLAPGIGRKGGILKPEITVKFIAVSLIFINSGISIKTEDLFKALTQWRLHMFIQVFTLLGIPITLWVVVSVLESETAIDMWLLKGLLVVGSMPPPVSSAVLLTKGAGGNEAAAIFNSAMGSFLGILVTPAWLFFFLGTRTSVSLVRISVQLVVTVVIPLLAGQYIRWRYTHYLHSHHIPFGDINSIILLVIIYSTFCDTFSQTILHLSVPSLLAIIALVAVLQCVLIGTSFWLSSLAVFRFQKEDRISAVFCSTHKSLTLGLPILKALFTDHAMLTPLSVPLLAYHPTQIVLGGLLLPTLTAWRVDTQTRPRARTRLAKMV